MTRKEAVKIIKECKEKGFKHTFYTLNEYHTALDMAIQALEQEPCEDAISRAEVLDIIDSKDPNYAVIHFKEDVECLPSVSTEKTGHWILQPSNKEQGERDFIWWKCSECGQVIYSETEKDRREYHAFCSRCGAKMYEPQESEDKCHTCKHYTSGEHDGSCGSYICKDYSNWESEE